mmetsp:Transcript_29521/g.47197  ORF Transcript_29521/g.47197 Transcript_29521/m.47197 type:complete len:91 (+) Transcript_29521:1766-2038(+)
MHLFCLSNAILCFASDINFQCSFITNVAKFQFWRIELESMTKFANAQLFVPCLVSCWVHALLFYQAVTTFSTCNFVRFQHQRTELGNCCC